MHQQSFLGVSGRGIGVFGGSQAQLGTGRAIPFLPKQMFAPSTESGEAELLLAVLLERSLVPIALRIQLNIFESSFTFGKTWN